MKDQSSSSPQSPHSPWRGLYLAVRAWRLLDHRCTACGLAAPPRRFCAGCSTDFLNRGPGCRLCGTPVHRTGMICGRCLATTRAWSQYWFVQDYQGPWAELIRRFKYQAQLSLAPPLATLLAQQLKREGAADSLQQEGWQVTAMPMHWRRRQARGFNQAAELARLVALDLGLGYRQPLYRHQDTPALEDLTRAERRRAVRYAFGCELVSGRWLLVDDVFTTGASVTAAAEALKRSGAREVALATLARTPISADSHHNWMRAVFDGTPGAEDH